MSSVTLSLWFIVILWDQGREELTPHWSSEFAFAVLISYRLFESIWLICLLTNWIIWQSRSRFCVLETSSPCGEKYLQMCMCRCVCMHTKSSQTSYILVKLESFLFETGNKKNAVCFYNFYSTLCLGGQCLRWRAVANVVKLYKELKRMKNNMSRLTK